MNKILIFLLTICCIANIHAESKELFLMTPITSSSSEKEIIHLIDRSSRCRYIGKLYRTVNQFNLVIPNSICSRQIEPVNLIVHLNPSQLSYEIGYTFPTNK